MLLIRSHFSGFSPSFQPGFPCFLSGSVYLAFCLFPFILPCFAPTAVPQVLTIFHLSISLWCSSLLPLSFVRFRLGFDYSASVSSFPFFPFPPHSGLSGAIIHLPFRLLPCFPSDFGTQLPAIPFSVSLFRITGATQLPTFFRFLSSPSFSAVPLGFHFRFWLLGWAMHPEN